MLLLVTAAEMHYRHESAWRDRELALLASIRERREHCDDRAHLIPAVVAGRSRTARHPRGTWARPIGAPTGVTVGRGPACAVA